MVQLQDPLGRWSEAVVDKKGNRPGRLVWGPAVLAGHISLLMLEFPHKKKKKPSRSATMVRSIGGQRVLAPRQLNAP